MGEQLLADLLALEAEGGVFLEPLDAARHAAVELAAQLVLFVATDLADQRRHPTHHLVRRPLAGLLVQPDVLAEQAETQGAELAGQAGGDALLHRLVLQQLVQLAQQLVEHGLVAALVSQQVEQLAAEGGQIHLAQLGGGAALDEAAHPLVAQGMDAVAGDADQLATERLGIARLAQPAGQPRRRVERLELGQHLRGGEEMGADEVGEILAQARLLARDDRRVRDRQAQGMAKQCGDGEPVGDRADHRRLGEGRQVAPAPGRLRHRHMRGQRVQRGGQQQQTEGDGLHPRQRGIPDRHRATPCQWLAAQQHSGLPRRFGTLRTAQGQPKLPLCSLPQPSERIIPTRWSPAACSTRRR
ncbi:hypothetical protein D3C80_1188500 [compost metagenome]